jgi:4-aminobutyrate aminotransferase
MKNADVAKRRDEAISRGVGMQTQIYVDRALNSEVWDIEGNRYIDFAAGIAVVNTGHCHPKVMDAVSKQLSKFTHTCHQVLPYEHYIRLAERLNAVVPAPKRLKTRSRSPASPPAATQSSPLAAPSTAVPSWA